MLSLFPGLLYLAPLATTLIRVAAGLTLLYVAYDLTVARGEIASTKFLVVGRIPQWFVLFGALVIFVAAVLLVIGLYTQAAAIVGILFGLKDMIFARKYRNVMPLAASTGALLFIMSLSLLFSGAGAFAFDLPL
jgi:hypothetical protein